MKIALRFFSTFRDLAGVKESTIDLGRDATVGVLFDELVARYPGLASLGKSVVPKGAPLSTSWM